MWRWRGYAGDMYNNPSWWPWCVSDYIRKSLRSILAQGPLAFSILSWIHKTAIAHEHHVDPNTVHFNEQCSVSNDMYTCILWTWDCPWIEQMNHETSTLEWHSQIQKTWDYRTQTQYITVKKVKNNKQKHYTQSVSHFILSSGVRVCIVLLTLSTGHFVVCSSQGQLIH